MLLPAHWRGSSLCEGGLEDLVGVARFEAVTAHLLSQLLLFNARVRGQGKAFGELNVASRDGCLGSTSEVEPIGGDVDGVAGWRIQREALFGEQLVDRRKPVALRRRAEGPQIVH
eukprot:PRCOL_00000832-RA